MEDRIAELLLHNKIGWVVRVRVNKQLKFPGKGKYDDMVELTLEAVGPTGLKQLGEGAEKGALRILEETMDGLAEQLEKGLKKLMEAKTV